MKTIEAIRALFAKAAADNAGRQKDLKALEQKLASQEAAANAALERGDAEQLVKIEDEQKLTRAKIRVMKHQLSSSVAPCTQEEMQDAWKAYVQTYQKDLAKAAAVFEKHRRELCDEYRKYVAIQNEALKTREEFGDLLGIDNTQVQQAFRMSYIPSDDRIGLPTLDYGGYQMRQYDPLYFRSTDVMTEEEFDKMDSILRLHRYHE